MVEITQSLITRGDIFLGFATFATDPRRKGIHLYQKKTKKAPISILKDGIALGNGSSTVKKIYSPMLTTLQTQNLPSIKRLPHSVPFPAPQPPQQPTDLPLSMKLQDSFEASLYLA